MESVGSVTFSATPGVCMATLNRTRDWLTRNFIGSLLGGWLVIAVVGWFTVGR